MMESISTQYRSGHRSKRNIPKTQKILFEKWIGRSGGYQVMHNCNSAIGRSLFDLRLEQVYQTEKRSRQKKLFLVTVKAEDTIVLINMERTHA